MSRIQEILQLLRESRFDTAVPLVKETLRTAATESPQTLIDVARELLRYQGPESPAAMTAAENLAGLLGSIGNVDEAIALREQILAHVSGRFPRDDPRVMIVRDGLSILYQRAGHEEKLRTLYRDTGLCEHLQPAEEYVRGHGGRVISVGRPWSANCHVWVYFDTILDCDRLIKGLGLASCVQVHDHRGTHDGSERGIVCTVHDDGVMGPHPSDAPASAKIVTVP